MAEVPRRLWYYGVVEEGEESRFCCSSNHASHEFIAEDCADSYFSECDGWESHWPLTFVLFLSEEGPEIARFTVEMETVPQFRATEVHVAKSEPNGG